MDEVYVVVESWQLDSGDASQDIIVYNNLKDAQDYLKKAKAFWRKEYLERFSEDEIDEEEDEMTYVVCEKGEYLYNHTDVIIYQRLPL